MIIVLVAWFGINIFSKGNCITVMSVFSAVWDISRILPWFIMFIVLCCCLLCFRQLVIIMIIVIYHGHSGLKKLYPPFINRVTTTCTGPRIISAFLNPAHALHGGVSYFAFVCVCVCLCVCPLTKYLKKYRTYQLHFFVDAFPVTQGGNHSILKKIAPG